MATPHLSSPNGDRPIGGSRTDEADAEPTLTDPIRLLPQAAADQADTPARPDGEGPAGDPLLSLEQRKELFAETLRKKLEQGYEIESQTETEAILFTKGRRRWSGILGSKPDTRQSSSVDEQGRTSTRSL